MNVLLLSMPDTFEHMPPVAIRMPNGALASLAGNIDPHHHVAVADLILVQASVRATVERMVRDLAPDVVGLSVMTFQRATALKIARLVRTLRPSTRVVVGGYDPSLDVDAYTQSPDVDFIVRGEGEHTLCELLRALENDRDASGIAGLSYRTPDGFQHNRDRAVVPLASSALRLPNRAARVLRGYTLLGRHVDVVETSRGCTYDCSFCSIIEMRGRNFHPYSIDRVLADIADARAHGAEAIFLVDDNITLDIERFENLRCLDKSPERLMLGLERVHESKEETDRAASHAQWHAHAEREHQRQKFDGSPDIVEDRSGRSAILCRHRHDSQEARQFVPEEGMDLVNRFGGSDIVFPDADGFLGSDGTGIFDKSESVACACRRTHDVGRSEASIDHLCRRHRLVDGLASSSTKDEEGFAVFGREAIWHTTTPGSESYR